MELNGDLNAIKSKFGSQSHIIKHWDRLTRTEKDSLLNQVNGIDFEHIYQAYQKTIHHENAKLDDDISPPSYDIFDSYKNLDSDDQLRAKYTDIAYKAIGEGKVAVLLLAGGQGTRLGVNYPKGMYSVNLPSGKSLYHMHAERLLCLTRLVGEKLGGNPVITWYIMTSEHTQEQTENYFRKHNYFGLDSLNIVFFDQDLLPCLDFEGKVIMESPSHVSKAPNGNGGLYKTMRERKILDDMKERGVKYIQTYCVDNILVKIADPLFLGFCIANDVDCAAKVLEKVVPTEPIGVLARYNSKYKVVEYSEISIDTAKKLSDGGIYTEAKKGKLMYHCGNICIHFLSLTFIDRVSQVDIETQLPYHVAKKKIPYWSEEKNQTVIPKEPNGIKLEKFIFDVFPYADRFGIFEVAREEEFAPLKNPPSANTDCPSSCKRAQLAIFKQWALRAGAKLAKDTIVEISPLVSLNGEGLEFLNGKTLEGVQYIKPGKSGQVPIIIAVDNWVDTD